MTGPFVVIDNAVFRKACVVDHAGVLRHAPGALEAQRFDTTEAASSAVDATCELQGWRREAYHVIPLANWEEEQLSPGRRRKKATAAKGDGE